MSPPFPRHASPVYSRAPCSREIWTSKKKVSLLSIQYLCKRSLLNEKKPKHAMHTGHWVDHNNRVGCEQSPPKRWRNIRILPTEIHEMVTN